ncbi:hypothetical protein PSPPH_A0043 (plasmid) [Pseudomonas savastanoi pv. phaseolicola 1448A]|uniref:Uncharacterized protein n=4 Tax=Pseudomonas savastanoi TaxID=29438 RepID=A0A3M5GB14_PSESS|nr:hypothetical protein PSPPH_A0043 [Pseudomonas savastanoi pv. phaseolicola 1448A]KPY11895.1 hypothetical protein ALO55_101417 [Pseudomonas savastanoi pv. phaseolicola]RMM58046.1 hypothetical protein ALQ74_04429 [Pseudomonas savastanoi pv. glycinea]RMS81059.1 hypothetical protein ALP58_101337 [Pseudomonas savastanoi]RMQ50196.1 hypothetical protein ALQ02_04863 [Pseudomonas savastanoi pv. phaseolicola]
MQVSFAMPKQLIYMNRWRYDIASGKSSLRSSMTAIS